MRTIPVVVLSSLVALAACEKAGAPSSKESGALAKGEASLLADLPSGNVALFGGNIHRIQGFMQASPFASLMGSLESVSPGMKEWTSCFLDTGGKTVEMMGAVAYAGSDVTMRYVMTGFGVAQIEACAKKAGFTASVDADGKYVAVTMPGPMGTNEVGYLVLADGALMTRTEMAIPPVAGATVKTSRAELEADVAAAARSNATTDTGLVAELARIDRGRAMWFVADAGGTPIADKAGLLRGWIDLRDRGMELDMTVQIKDPALAKQITDAVPEMKKQAKQLGGEMGKLLDGLKLERKGDRVRFMMKLSERQLELLAEQMAPFLPKP